MIEAPISAVVSLAPGEGPRALVVGVQCSRKDAVGQKCLRQPAYAAFRSICSGFCALPPIWIWRGRITASAA